MGAKVRKFGIEMIGGVGNVEFWEKVEVMVIGYYGWLRRIESGWEIIVIMTIYESVIGDEC
jgi:hypothetical protein